MCRKESLNMKRMSILLIVSLGGILLLVSSCQESPTEGDNTPKSSVVTGYIRDSLNNPIAGAIVIDLGTLGAVDTTDASGAYTLEFQLTSQYTTTIRVTATGYYPYTDTVTVTAGGTLTRNIRLTRDYSLGGVVGSVRPAANISLVSVSSRDIAIRGTGLTDNAVLKFQVSDSSGNPIINGVPIKFSLLSGPGGGEYISPDSTLTDNLGMVTATVWSGNKAGIAQVNAVTANGTVKAMPVTITITGGYPDANSFSISRTTVNLAGMIYDNLQTTIQVVVGDRFGNPPVPSVVKFTTTGGIITGSAITNNLGIATATLVTGNPRPANGIVYVTASVVGDTSYRRSDSLISRTTTVIFSGRTVISGPSSPVIVPDSGMVSFRYRVSDINGNPIVGGSKITVRIVDLLGAPISSVQLLGQKDVDILDADTTTYFTVTLAKTSRVAPGGSAVIIVDVKTPAEGNGDLSRGFTAYVQSTAAGGGGFALGQQPYSIELLSVDRNELRVAEGSTDAESYTRVTFVVKDSVGNQIINFPNSGIPRTYVSFSLANGGLGGNEVLFPAIDSVSDAGTVTTMFRAGTRSGIVRVIANIVGSNRPAAYVDLTISGGYPDENRIVATLDKLNYPGLIQQTGKVGKTLGTVYVTASDQFNNPPKQGTKVYFTTTGGSIEPVATLDARGATTVQLYDGGQIPQDNGRIGHGHITLTTYGRDVNPIIKTIPFMFSGNPQISFPSIARDSFYLFDGGTQVIEYIVSDIYSNPLAEGNAVSITVEGSAAAAIEITGDRNYITEDTRDENSIFKRIIVQDTKFNQGPSGDFTLVFNVNGPNGTVTKRLYGILLAPGEIPSAEPALRRPASMQVLNISSSDLVVAGTGGRENATISIQVLDSLGKPIPSTPKYKAYFSLNFFPNVRVPGGTEPIILTASDSTDGNGQLHLAVKSGTNAGVAQISVRVDRGDGTMIAGLEPVVLTVHGGFPDQDHFTIIPEQFVLPVWNTMRTFAFTVAVGDTFSNPVKVGTPVYFHSQAGIIQTGNEDFRAYTNTSGLASVNLITVNPTPMQSGYYDPTIYDPYNDTVINRRGFHWVWAQTQTSNGRWVYDSVAVVWNEPPVIISVPDSIVLPANGSSALYDLYIYDVNGNPLPTNTKITAVFVYPQNTMDLAFDVYGDLPATISAGARGRFPGPGITHFRFGITDNSAPNASVGTSTSCRLVIEVPGLGTLYRAIPVRIQ